MTQMSMFDEIESIGQENTLDLLIIQTLGKAT